MKENEPEFAENDLMERIKTIRNRCDIALLLLRPGTEHLLPTILEDLFYGAQEILRLYCIKEEE